MLLASERYLSTSCATSSLLSPPTPHPTFVEHRNFTSVPRQFIRQENIKKAFAYFGNRASHSQLTPRRCRDPTRPDPTRPEPTRTDPNRTEPTRPDPTRTEPNRKLPCTLCHHASDLDGSKSITVDELMQVFGSREHTLEVMKDIDLNHDGVISEDEFKVRCQLTSSGGCVRLLYVAVPLSYLKPRILENLPRYGYSAKVVTSLVVL